MIPDVHPNILARLAVPPIRPIHVYEMIRGQRAIGPHMKRRLELAANAARDLEAQGCMPQPRKRGRPRKNGGANR